MATVASGLNSGSGFGSSDTITSTTLNNHVNNATVTSIVNADVASNAALAVTKLADITNNNLIGRVDNANNANVPIVIGGSGDAGVLFDNDDLLDNSDTAGGSATRGATQQSIKAYVDNGKINCLLTQTSSTLSISSLPFSIPFDSEISDSTGMHSGSDAKMTIGTAGVYIINATVETSNTNNGDFKISIFKGSSAIATIVGDYSTTGAGQSFNITHTALLAASDEITVRIETLEGSSSSTSATINGPKTYFNATLVS